MFFLLEGEVELVVDVPLTQDKDTLLANLLQMVGRDPSVGLGPRARSVAGVEGALDGSGGDLSPPVMAGKRYVRRIRWTDWPLVCLQQLLVSASQPRMVSCDDGVFATHAGLETHLPGRCSGSSWGGEDQVSFLVMTASG